MKIDFIDVKWKNFLSYGNNITELKLNTNKTTLIIGKNGSGKSTVSDVLCFNLFGKAFRSINKGDLINSINGKELWTEVNFVKGKTRFKIVRGIKPNIFEIWKNDVLLPQNADTEYQTLLEEELGFNLKTFKQIALIGKASYIPFMQQTPANRRDMVEDLLDIKVFSHMNNITKERISKNKTEISIIESSISHIKQAIAAVSNTTKDFEDEIKKDIKAAEKRINECEKLIETSNAQLIQLNEAIKDFLNGLENKTKYDNNLRKLIDKEKELETYIKVYQKEIDFFKKNENCPSCKQSIEKHHKEHIIDEKQKLIDENQEFIDKMEEHYIINQNKLKEIGEKENKIANAKQTINSINSTIIGLKNEIKTKNENIIVLKKRLEKKNTNTKELEEKLVATETQMADLFVTKETLETVSSLLKDGGIKTQVIKKYIPIMNKLINKYLAAMDFFVDFQIDEEFNEVIKSRYRDKFKYQNFSEGEKLRIDLAILFAWRAIAKNRNSVNSNILFLDEIFESSLDDNGTEEFLKILNDLTDGTNTFIISHKSDQLFDKFEKVYKFEKVQSFSRLS